MKMTERSAKWMEGVLANCEKNTGHRLEHWVALAKKAKVSDPQGARAWGKRAGLSIVYANAVMETLFPQLEGSDEQWVDAQYSGAKARLRPLYEALVKAVRGLGKDVEIMPRKSQVTCSRSKSFAIIRPAAKDRIDLSLMLPGTKATGRLVANPKAMGSDPSHVVGLNTDRDIDRELIGWLKAAYQRAASAAKNR